MAFDLLIVVQIVGRWKRITMPMSNAVVLSTLRWIEGYHNALGIAAYIALIYGLTRTDLGALASVFEDWDIQLFGQWPVLVSIVFSAAAKLILTTLAGFDFIISTIVEQRRCELPGGSIFHLDPSGPESQQGQDHRPTEEESTEEANASLFRQRDERLDDVCALFPSPWNEPWRPPTTRP